MIKKYNIFIIEDEILIANHIKICIEKGNFTCCGISKSYQEAESFLNENKDVDLILLDVFLYGAKSGIDLAKMITEKYKIPFIYLTSFTDRNTLDLIKHTSPVGYLSKPLNEVNLLVNLEIFCANLQSGTNLFSFTIGSVKHVIDLNKIVYIKSDHVYVELTFTDVKLLVRCSLTKMLELLPQNTLLQVNRSVAVNPRVINAVRKNHVELFDISFKISSLYMSNFS